MGIILYKMSEPEKHLYFVPFKLVFPLISTKQSGKLNPNLEIIGEIHKTILKRIGE